MGIRRLFLKARSKTHISLCIAWIFSVFILLEYLKYSENKPAEFSHHLDSGSITVINKDNKDVRDVQGKYEGQHLINISENKFHQNYLNNIINDESNDDIEGNSLFGENINDNGVVSSDNNHNSLDNNDNNKENAPHGLQENSNKLSEINIVNGNKIINNEEDTLWIHKKIIDNDVHERRQVWPDVPLSNKFGNKGSPCHVKRTDLNQTEQEKWDAGIKQHAFNQYASDLISVHRTLPDVRHSQCKGLHFEGSMPSTSVVIIFHNEAWTTLLRTVHTVLNRSPAHLLHEIILVDDFSDLEYLKEPLDLYMAQHPKVKVVHTKERQGLIRARLTGTSIATADTITFLDSHCEASEGWLEPMMARIGEDPKHVVMPIIDIIDSTTFAYVSGGSADKPPVGSFTWTMSFTWASVSGFKITRDHITDPVRSPTMAGGLFAINREYFHQIGLYDTGMEIWGGENLELSFRIWMCGGTLEVIPCSKVGHVFRGRNPNLTDGGAVRRNTVRMVEVWLDNQYKEVFYERIQFYPSKAYYGDVSERQELKKNLQCKNFTWYLNNVATNLFAPTKTMKSGTVSSSEKIAGDILCLAADEKADKGVRKLLIKSCEKLSKRNIKHNMKLYFSDLGEIRTLEVCMDYSQLTDTLVFMGCHGQQGNQQWTLIDDGRISHPGTRTCLTFDKDESGAAQVKMMSCTRDKRQVWIWNTT